MVSATPTPESNVSDEDSGFSLVDAIEVVIDSLDSNDSAMVSRGETGHLWKFDYGSVQVFVQLSGETQEDMLTVWANVLKLPVKNDGGLMRHLLELNWHTTLETHFAIHEGQVAVVSSRSVADLSAGEISRAITLVAGIADDHDDRLQAEYPAV